MSSLRIIEHQLAKTVAIMTDQELTPEDIQREERLAILIGDLTDRMQGGESIDINVVCEQHPDLAEELRDLWGIMVVADAAGSHSIHETLSSNSTEGGAATLELPCRFGDYELLEELGRGGMGVVYRAHQTSLNRTVAIKMILRGQLASQADIDRFQVEAEAAARLNHPGIVPVYEVGQQDGRPYFSMNYVAGQTLADRLIDGPLVGRDAARILVAVARAIHYAHRQGVLHRDLKPSNILLDVKGNPLVTDFGLAKRVTEAESLTRTGSVLGTPAYIAPEQAAGDRGQVGPSSDVYSLGSILYHMLTGRPPFQAASAVDTILLVLEQDPVPPRVLNPKADRDLEMIALRCLQKPPDLRYSTADSLADDLEAYLNDEVVSARSGRFLQVITRLFRETHHAPILENWGVLWMWHSLVLFTACLLTNALHLAGFNSRWYYILLWTAGFGAWAGVFWYMRKRLGPVTFVERQIAHIWAASMISIGLLFFIEMMMGFAPLTLSPILGLVNGMVFMVKAGILSGTFYIQAFVLFATAFVMAWFPDYAHLIFGSVSACCFFFPGLKYYRQRRRRSRLLADHAS
ncbi:MAG: serine/threonine protein kinase [Pirellulaceae bacterium]